jgi:hypothetical protein
MAHWPTGTLWGNATMPPLSDCRNKESITDDLAIEAVGQSIGQLKNTREDQFTPLGKMFPMKTAVPQERK